MKNKFSKLMAFVLAFVLLSMTAWAVVSYADFQDGTFSKTMHKDETARFDVALFTVSPPMTYSIRMLDPNGNTAKVWFNNAVDNDGWVEDLGLIVTPADITIGGEYSIIITSLDGNGDNGLSTLTLNVINNPPVITNVNVPSETNAGNAVDASFSGYDPDGDAISYRIYVDNALVSNSNTYRWTPTAGTYTFRFELSDGEDTAVQTRTVRVIGGGGADSRVEARETLVLARDIEISQVYGDFIKIRNTKGERLENFEMIITYPNSFNVYQFDLGKNDVVFRQISASLPENHTYAAKVEVKADGLEDSGYLLINN